MATLTPPPVQHPIFTDVARQIMNPLWIRWFNDVNQVTGGSASSPILSASNQGTAGVGVFDAQSGTELQFRNVAPGSSKITVTLDGKNIDVDAAEANFTLDNIGGTLAVTKGGTGQTSYSDGQLLIGNTTGSTLALATLTATVGETSITNGSGSITLGLADDAQLPGTEGINCAGGTTGERPGTPVEGDLRKNTSSNTIEYYDGSGWNDLTAGGTPDWELIESQTASSSSSIVFTSSINSTYSTYKFILTAVAPATDAVNLLMRTSTDGGVGYDSGASDYAWIWEVISMTTSPSQVLAGDDADTAMTIGATLGTGTQEIIDVEITLFNPSSTNYTRMTNQGTLRNASGTDYMVNGSGKRLSAADVDAVQILKSSGNISSGIFKMYGIRA